MSVTNTTDRYFGTGAPGFRSVRSAREAKMRRRYGSPSNWTSEAIGIRVRKTTWKF